MNVRTRHFLAATSALCLSLAAASCATGQTSEDSSDARRRDASRRSDATSIADTSVVPDDAPSADGASTPSDAAATDVTVTTAGRYRLDYASDATFTTGAPLEGATIRAAVFVRLTVLSAPSAGIDHVEWLVDTQSFRTDDLDAPYDLTYLPASFSLSQWGGDGSHTITARVVLAGGARRDTVSSSVTVASGTAPSPGGITHGEQIGPANTGYTAYRDPALGRTLTLGDLATRAGGTLALSGQTIERARFTSGVRITASNVTLRGCLIDMGDGGADLAAIRVAAGASNVRIEYCTVRVNAGHAVYFGALIEGGARGTTIDHADLSRGENVVTDEGDDTVIQYSYLHDAARSHPSGHQDCIETYGGDNHTYRFNRLTHPVDETAVINIAPWSSGSSVDGVNVEDNFIDGGIMHFVIDNQSQGIGHVRVRRNTMGGHTVPDVGGAYFSINNCEHRAIVGTESALTASPRSILWPTSGSDVNYWSQCTGLSPDRAGQVIVPSTQTGGCLAPTTP